MDATTSIDTTQTKRLVDRLLGGPLSIRDMASAIHARWRAAFAAGQLGPDPEITIGRGTGARI
jgi:hypothetical protein